VLWFVTLCFLEVAVCCDRYGSDINCLNGGGSHIFVHMYTHQTGRSFFRIAPTNGY
jgi:hypothetical protein